MYDFPVTVDPQVVRAFFTEKAECYFPMNFSCFLGNTIASEIELTDQMFSVNPAWLKATHKTHVAPVIWLLARDIRLSHIKQAVIATDDAYVCFIRDARPGKCYTHSVSREVALSRQDHMIYLGSRH